MLSWVYPVSNCVSWELQCINWSEPLYRQPLNTSWVRAGGCKQSLPRYPPNWSRSVVGTWMSAGKFPAHYKLVRFLVLPWPHFCRKSSYTFHAKSKKYPTSAIHRKNASGTCKKHASYTYSVAFDFLCYSFWNRFKAYNTVVHYGRSLWIPTSSAKHINSLCFRGQAWWHAIHLELY